MEEKLRNILEKPKFSFRERHILWNWEKSQKSEMEKEFVRYHFVIVDDKFREGKIEKIISNFHKKSIVNYSFEEIRRIEGKFEGTGFRYLFITYDSQYTPQFLSFEKVSKNVKRDFNLRERKFGSLEDYVEKLYG